MEGHFLFLQEFSFSSKHHYPSESPPQGTMCLFDVMQVEVQP